MAVPRSLCGAPQLTLTGVEPDPVESVGDRRLTRPKPVGRRTLVGDRRRDRLAALRTAVAVSLTGWQCPETEWFAALIESAEPGDFFRTASAVAADDVSGLLPDVDVRC